MRSKIAKINDNPGEIFIKIWGKCAECGVIINAYAPNKPAANGIDIHVLTTDTTGVMHAKKRQLHGINRANVVKKICASSVYAWRKNKANEIMSFGDVKPPHLYNENVLRKARQLEKDLVQDSQKFAYRSTFETGMFVKFSEPVMLIIFLYVITFSSDHQQEVSRPHLTIANLY